MIDFKCAIIYGYDDERRNIKNGQIEKIGNINSGELHIKCLLDLINRRYHDIKLFNNLNENHQPEVASYLLSLLGNIIFLNTKQTKLGILIYNNEFNDEQKKTLMDLVSKLSDYTIYIYNDLRIEDGILINNSEIISFPGDHEKNIEKHFKNNQR